VVALPGNGERVLEAVRAAGAGPELALLRADGMEAAVALARAALPAGGVVLLSPAAPSYGAFRNFEERGDFFTSAATNADAPPR
jgi:UDP-N-acetylmuramoylalanine--D-glutamate ligase